MIYLLRHGETVWNTAGRFQGQMDSPLTLRGIEQADQLGRLLARKILGIESQFEVQVSPLGRAQQTAERITRSIQLPSKDEARLMEVTLGSWDGMTHFEIDMEYPGALQGADGFDWYFRSPDGETFDDVCDRAKGWLADISQPTIAISHGLLGRILRGLYMGLSRRAMLELPVPQNGFYRLADRQVDFIELE
ncbi:histidine phosphatase family protein [Mesorhizobium sp. BAC0120]|uniref:histidine phosphatase family protein n=1 Tax=Mesorhizobium sp. BAC0120 TaxID=3090670 RepID=UPI00298CF8D9|nr:histidine phosphatase family protein [Mesorhizobium sp. BAC0120]MDW6020418.1 histidine phosphatase family protein [Mesorhizobium sp. BAC0120]